MNANNGFQLFLHVSLNCRLYQNRMDIGNLKLSARVHPFFNDFKFKKAEKP